MQKIVLGLIALTGITSFSPVKASSIATITALKSPAWIQYKNTKTELRRNNILRYGDQIITGDTGRVEIRLWLNATLELYANSEITILKKTNTNMASAGSQPELYILKGKACINYITQPNAKNNFEINIGDTVLASINPQSHVCILRQDSLSSIVLRAGSVQVTHSVDPDKIVLNETGIELKIDDDGSYELLFSDIGDSLTPEKEKPMTAETPVKAASLDDAPDIVDSNIVVETIESDKVVETPVEEENLADAPDIVENNIVAETIESGKVVETPVEEENLGDVPVIVENNIVADASELDKAVKKYYKGFPKLAINMIEPLAMSGDVDAQFLLGNMLYSLLKKDKYSVEGDPVRWYKLAAEQDSPGANYALGAIHHNKWTKFNRQEDVAMAISYYEKADKLGYADAKTPLTKLKSRGKSAKKSKSLVYTNSSFRRSE